MAQQQPCKVSGQLGSSVVAHTWPLFVWLPLFFAVATSDGVLVNVADDSNLQGFGSQQVFFDTNLALDFLD